MTWIKQIPHLDLSKNKFSQSGEEIVIKYIFDNIGTTDKYLVDFGAGDGKYLSNSLALLESGWTALRMDGDNKGNPDVKQEFISPENILELFKKYEVPHMFDFLSIDLDSCDFQLLQRILTYYIPRVICCEYNPAFEPHESKFLKYEKGYQWDETTKYGFSLLAGRKLMNSHGYSLIHNHKFLNLFFIHNAVLAQNGLPAQNIEVPNQKHIFHRFNPNAIWIDY